MKVAYSSTMMLTAGQGISKISEKFIFLLFIYFLAATAFCSGEVEHPQETAERNIREADFLRLKKEVLDALKTNAQNIREADFQRLKREVLDAQKTNTQNTRDADFNTLKKEVLDALKIERAGEESYGGAVYVRWGRTVCSPDSEALYQGVAGGSYMDHTGGGSNYLCLPLDPIWGVYDETEPKYTNLYGAEYQYATTFSLINNDGRPLHDNNVPCVVCRSPTMTSVIMIPARNQCYSGMRTEYTGFLMTGRLDHKGRTEFVCMDGEPQSDPAGYRNEQGALFFPVEGICGSLPCPPYAPKREITCAVCSK